LLFKSFSSSHTKGDSLVIHGYSYSSLGGKGYCDLSTTPSGSSLGFLLPQEMIKKDNRIIINLSIFTLEMTHIF
jgi:hypothetical protein